MRVVKSRKRRRFDLEDLINGITDQNRHPETDWGPPVGNEAW
jgi:antitoxin component of MazEF toxin-antitoxin module